MIVVCINNKQVPGRLTIGKEYEVNEINSSFVWVLSDDGIRRAYRRWRFSTREDLRKKALSTIGI